MRVPPSVHCNGGAGYRSDELFPFAAKGRMAAPDIVSRSPRARRRAASTHDENSRATSISCQNEVCEFESSQPSHGVGSSFRMGVDLLRARVRVPLRRGRCCVVGQGRSGSNRRHRLRRQHRSQDLLRACQFQHGLSRSRPEIHHECVQGATELARRL
jgi:hypothetical protein